MKVIPIQGLNIKGNIGVVVQVFNERMLIQALGISELGNVNVDNKYYIDEFTFVDRSNLVSKIKDSKEVEKILIKFKETKTFAIINTRLNKYTEFYDLKVALSIIYIAKRCRTESENDFLNILGVNYGYFTSSGIKSTKWHVSIGEKNIDENDFDLTIPVYYTIDDMPESWSIPKHMNESMSVQEDISYEINKISLSIVKSNEISDKLRSSLYLLFNTLKFENIDLVIIMYSTILETLLLAKNEDNQRKKVSIRSACLIKNLGNYQEKEYIASWVYDFYKYRNSIVHDGKSFIELQQGDEFVVFNHSLTLIQHLIFNLIKIFVDMEINSIQHIKSIVENNKEIDKLNNAFDYISKNITLNYEED